jgi:small redox-active disulfide protein 2
MSETLNDGFMKRIQVIGPGCGHCKRLAERVETAARELGQAYDLVKVTDLVEIIDLGFRIPALVMNGQLKTEGFVPSLSEVKKMLG